MLKCIFSSPTEKRVEPDIQGIFFETSTGQRGVLPNHISMVAYLKPGSIVRLKKNMGELVFRIGISSFFRIIKNEAIISTQEFKEEKEY